jgi:hypothetical protein
MGRPPAQWREGGRLGGMAGFLPAEYSVPEQRGMGGLVAWQASCPEAMYGSLRYIWWHGRLPARKPSGSTLYAIFGGMAGFLPAAGQSCKRSVKRRAQRLFRLLGSHARGLGANDEGASRVVGGQDGPFDLKQMIGFLQAKPSSKISSIRAVPLSVSIRAVPLPLCLPLQPCLFPGSFPTAGWELLLAEAICWCWLPQLLVQVSNCRFTFDDKYLITGHVPPMACMSLPL